MFEILIRVLQPLARRVVPPSLKPKLVKLVNDIREIRNREFERKRQTLAQISRSEMERIKNQMYGLDGKVNTIVFGLPSRLNYQAQPILRPALGNNADLALKKAPEIATAKQICSFAEGAWDSSLRKNLLTEIIKEQPQAFAHLLVLGDEARDTCQLIQETGVAHFTLTAHREREEAVFKWDQLRKSDFLTQCLLQTEKSLSGIVACHTLTQLLPIELPALITAVKHALKPGGFFLDRTPKSFSPEDIGRSLLEQSPKFKALLDHLVKRISLKYRISF